MKTFFLLAAALGVASAYEKDGGGWGGGKPGTMGDPYAYGGSSGGYPSPWPYTCVFEPEAQLQLHQCLIPGTAICRDGWAFGIDSKDGHVKLWKGDKVLFKEWPGAKKLCIGEKEGYGSPGLRASMPPYWWYDAEIPYLYVLYDEGRSKAYLHCEGVGREDVDALLKIVDLGEDYLYEEPVVKFKKGPGYENALWWIDAKGDAKAGPSCNWRLDTKAPTSAPTPATTTVPFLKLSDDEKCAMNLPYGQTPLDLEGGSFLSYYNNAPHSRWIQELTASRDNLFEFSFKIVWNFKDGVGGNPVTRTLKEHITACIPSGCIVDYEVYDDKDKLLEEFADVLWRYSDNAGSPDVDGTGSDFSEDDGIWGAGFSPLNGDTPGPETNIQYAVGNYNSADSACRPYVYGAEFRNTQYTSIIYYEVQ